MLSRSSGVEILLSYLCDGRVIPSLDEMDQPRQLRLLNSCDSSKLEAFSFDTWTLASAVLFSLIMFARTIPRLARVPGAFAQLSE